MRSRDVMVGPGQVVKAFGPGLQVAVGPFVEPDLGAADGSADALDGSAGEAQGNSSMTSCQFVVHGDTSVWQPWRLPAEVVVHEDSSWRNVLAMELSDAMSAEADSNCVSCCRQRNDQN